MLAKVTSIHSLLFSIIHVGVAVSVSEPIIVRCFSFLSHDFIVPIVVPQEFLFDPITKTYGDPSRRPEVRCGTVEYAATADYMV